MGSRLHYAQHYNPEMKGGYFNRDEDAFESLYFDKLSEDGWHEETTHMYEVQRSELQAYVDEIKAYPAEEMNKYLVEYKNEYVIELLEEVLTSDDDNIRIEWY